MAETKNRGSVIPPTGFSLAIGCQRLRFLGTAVGISGVNLQMKQGSCTPGQRDARLQRHRRMRAYRCFLGPAEPGVDWGMGDPGDDFGDGQWGVRRETDTFMRRASI